MTMSEAGAMAQGSLGLEGQYLTFVLGTEVFGLPILSVQEIIGIMPVTRVPRTPEYVRGVINLRGKVIPVIDLRIKFGLEAKEDTARTCIIVAQVKHDGQNITMGVIVDEVSEVVEIAATQIEPPPAFGDKVAIDFVMGMGKVGQRVVMLLDIARVLTSAELTAAKQLTKEAEA